MTTNQTEKMKAPTITIVGADDPETLIMAHLVKAALDLYDIKAKINEGEDDCSIISFFKLNKGLSGQVVQIRTEIKAPVKIRKPECETS